LTVFGYGQLTVSEDENLVASEMLLPIWGSEASKMTRDEERSCSQFLVFENFRPPLEVTKILKFQIFFQTATKVGFYKFFRSKLNISIIYDYRSID
jgi:hypothetical protein